MAFQPMEARGGEETPRDDRGGQAQPWAAEARRMALGLLVALVLAAPASAQEVPPAPRPSAEITADVVSAYAWRGQRLSEGTVAQSLVAGEYRGFAASLWSNYDPGEYPAGSGSHMKFTEADVTFAYERGVGRGAIAAGFIYYSLRGASDTTELFVGYEFDVPLAPSARLYVDVDEGKGAFLVAGAGHSLTLPHDVSLDLEFEAGFNLRNALMGTDAEGHTFTGPYHGQVSVSTTIPVWRNLSVAGSLGVSFPLGSRARDAISSCSYDGATGSFLFGSLGLTASFAPAP